MSTLTLKEEPVDDIIEISDEDYDKSTDILSGNEASDVADLSSLKEFEPISENTKQSDVSSRKSPSPKEIENKLQATTPKKSNEESAFTIPLSTSDVENKLLATKPKKFNEEAAFTIPLSTRDVENKLLGTKPKRTNCEDAASTDVAPVKKMKPSEEPSKPTDLDLLPVNIVQTTSESNKDCRKSYESEQQCSPITVSVLQGATYQPIYRIYLKDNEGVAPPLEKKSQVSELRKIRARSLSSETERTKFDFESILTPPPELPLPNSANSSRESVIQSQVRVVPHELLERNANSLKISGVFAPQSNEDKPRSSAVLNESSSIKSYFPTLNGAQAARNPNVTMSSRGIFYPQNIYPNTNWSTSSVSSAKTVLDNQKLPTYSETTPLPSDPLRNLLKMPESVTNNLGYLKNTYTQQNLNQLPVNVAQNPPKNNGQSFANFPAPLPPARRNSLDLPKKRKYMKKKALISAALNCQWSLSSPAIPTMGNVNFHSSLYHQSYNTHVPVSTNAQINLTSHLPQQEPHQQRASNPRIVPHSTTLPGLLSSAPVSTSAQINVTSHLTHQETHQPRPSNHRLVLHSTTLSGLLSSAPSAPISASPGSAAHSAATPNATCRKLVTCEEFVKTIGPILLHMFVQSEMQSHVKSMWRKFNGEDGFFSAKIRDQMRQIYSNCIRAFHTFFRTHQVSEFDERVFVRDLSAYFREKHGIQMDHKMLEYVKDQLLRAESTDCHGVAHRLQKYLDQLVFSDEQLKTLQEQIRVYAKLREKTEALIVKDIESQAEAISKALESDGNTKTDELPEGLLTPSDTPEANDDSSEEQQRSEGSPVDEAIVKQEAVNNDAEELLLEVLSEEYANIKDESSSREVFVVEDDDMDQERIETKVDLSSVKLEEASKSVHVIESGDYVMELEAFGRIESICSGINGEQSGKSSEEPLEDSEVERCLEEETKKIERQLDAEENQHDLKKEIKKESCRCICGKAALHMCTCREAFYCSHECQFNDWSNHEKICTFPVDDD